MYLEDFASTFVFRSWFEATGFLIVRGFRELNSDKIGSARRLEAAGAAEVFGTLFDLWHSNWKFYFQEEIYPWIYCVN